MAASVTAAATTAVPAEPEPLQQPATAAQPLLVAGGGGGGEGQKEGTNAAQTHDSVIVEPLRT